MFKDGISRKQAIYTLQSHESERNIGDAEFIGSSSALLWPNTLVARQRREGSTTTHLGDLDAADRDGAVPGQGGSTTAVQLYDC